eukprot:m.67115 g.67115  ORF g.67115 m.67115 type:complete len:1426 (+) comp8205_c0_seq1:231-4508(+)
MMARYETGSNFTDSSRSSIVVQPPPKSKFGMHSPDTPLSQHQQESGSLTKEKQIVEDIDTTKLGNKVVEKDIRVHMENFGDGVYDAHGNSPAAIDPPVLQLSQFIGSANVDMGKQHLLHETHQNSQENFVLFVNNEARCVMLVVWFESQFYVKSLDYIDGQVMIKGSALVFPLLSTLLYYYSDTQVVFRDIPCPLHIINRDILSPANVATVAENMPSITRQHNNETEAVEGEPWTVRDVCDWLESIGIASDSFRRHGIDGIKLLQLSVLDLQQFGLIREDAKFARAQIDKLQHQFLVVEEEETDEDDDTDVESDDDVKISTSSLTESSGSTAVDDWVRSTFMIKESAGMLKVFDASTHEEVHDFKARLLDLLANNYSAIDNMYDCEDVDFVWSGDKDGWVKRLPNNIRIVESKWSEGDLCNWLEFVNLEECIPVITRLELSVADLKNLDPIKATELGDQYKVGAALKDATVLLNLRIMPTMKQTQAKKKSSQTQTSLSGTSSHALKSHNIGQLFQMEKAQTSPANHPLSRGIPNHVDKFALCSPWCRINEPSTTAMAHLRFDGTPANAFVVCRNEKDPNLLQLHVRRPGIGVESFNILDDGDGLRLEGTKKKCADLSELVHRYASNNDEKPLLLNLETSLHDHLGRPWFNPDLSPQDMHNMIKSQDEIGAFMVCSNDTNPSNSAASFALDFIGPDHQPTHYLFSRRGLNYQLDDEEGDHQLFPTVSDLINHYSFVRDNDLGVVLKQNFPKQANNPNLLEPWFHSADTPVVTLQRKVFGIGEGGFIVREEVCDEGDDGASAKYTLLFMHNDVLATCEIVQDDNGMIFFKVSPNSKFHSLSELVNACCLSKHPALPAALAMGPYVKQSSSPKKVRDTSPQNVYDLGHSILNEDNDNEESVEVEQRALDSSQRESLPHPVTGHGDLRWLLLDPVTKQQALRLLSNQPNGAFVVRSSERAEGFYTLSYVYEGKIYHELIAALLQGIDNDNGVYLASRQDRVFETIHDLVGYYRSTPGTELHCALTDYVFNPTYAMYLSEMQPWIACGLPRNEAVSMLEGKGDGAFIIRDSESSPDFLVLCYVYNGEVQQEYIQMFPIGITLEKEPSILFPDLETFVYHYSTPRDELLCPLRADLLDGVIHPLMSASFPPAFVHLPSRSASSMDGPNYNQMGTFQRKITMANNISSPFHPTTNAFAWGPSTTKPSLMHPESFLPSSSEHLTKESQRKMSLFVRSSAPDVLLNNSKTFYIQKPENKELHMFPMTSQRTMDARKSIFPPLPTKSASMPQLKVAAKPVPENHIAHHPRAASEGLILNKAKTDTVGNTLRRLRISSANIDSSNFPWLRKEATSKTVKEFLKRDGDFIIHQSEKGNIACLSLRHNRKLYAYEIVKADRRYIRLENSNVKFSKFVELVEHYVHPSQVDLPCNLGGT